MPAVLLLLLTGDDRNFEGNDQPYACSRPSSRSRAMARDCWRHRRCRSCLRTWRALSVNLPTQCICLLLQVFTVGLSKCLQLQIKYASDLTFKKPFLFRIINNIVSS